MATKRDCAFGIVRTASASATGTPIVFPMIESGKIGAEPKNYQRINSITPDICGIQGGGFDVTASFSGAECTTRDVLYLLALFMGGYSYNPTGTVHTITPATEGQYFFAARDLEQVLVTTDEAESAVGCKIETLTIDQQPNAYAKITMSAKGCDFGHAPGFEPSLSLAAIDAPLSWASLKTGGFQLGLNGGSMASETGRTGLKIEFSRVTNYGPITLAGNQPTRIVQGERKITVECTRLFEGAQATSEYAAFLAAQEFGIAATWMASTAICSITVPHIKISQHPVDEIGASDDPVMLTLAGTAYLSGADAIASINGVGGAALWS